MWWVVVKQMLIFPEEMEHFLKETDHINEQPQHFMLTGGTGCQIRDSSSLVFLLKTSSLLFFQELRRWMLLCIPRRRSKPAYFSQVQPDVHDLSQLSCSSCKMTHFPLTCSLGLFQCLSVSHIPL